MAKFNRNHRTIRRINADIRELARDPSPQYHAHPVGDDMFEWHFTIRGPKDTEFEGGVYHGRIMLPAEYPLKPPNIMFLTPNGRFQVKKKICLSISAYHPEFWLPAWGVRLILEALISFLPSPAEGAVGSLELSKEERKTLAAESRDYRCPVCGDPAEELPSIEDSEAASRASSRYASEIAKLQVVAPVKAGTTKDSKSEEQAAPPKAAAAPVESAAGATQHASFGEAAAVATADRSSSVDAGVDSAGVASGSNGVDQQQSARGVSSGGVGTAAARTGGLRGRRAGVEAGQGTAAAVAAAPAPAGAGAARVPPPQVPPKVPTGDTALLALAILLGLVLVFLLARKGGYIE